MFIWDIFTNFETSVYTFYNQVQNKTSTCWNLSYKMLCLFTACDPNCASGCTRQGAGKCDTTCVANYFLTSLYQCSRELLSRVLSDKWAKISIGTWLVTLNAAARCSVKDHVSSKGTTLIVDCLVVNLYQSNVVPVYANNGKLVLQFTTTPKSRFSTDLNDSVHTRRSVYGTGQSSPVVVTLHTHTHTHTHIYIYICNVT